MQASAVLPAATAFRPVKWAVSAPRDLSIQQRWALAVSVFVVHGVAGWLIARARPLELPPERAPISVQLIAPVQAPPVAAVAPQPAPVPPKKEAPLKPVLSTRAPSKNVLQAPPEPVNKPPVEAPPVPTPPAPAAVAPITAPPASAAAAPAASNEPPAPKQLSISSVRYAVPPRVVYPDASRRLGETGVVTLSVTVDETGHASDVRVAKSSGFSRLDQAAVNAMKAARFVPYMEGGVPRAFTVPAPINYDLSD